MSDRIRIITVLAVPMLLILFCGSTVKGQVTRGSDDGVLQELIREVRLLRETLQKVNVAAYRSQLLIERLRLQSAEVVRLTGDIENLQDEIAQSQLRTSQANERRTFLTNQIQQETNVELRKNAEAERDLLKDQLAQEALKERELTQRQARLTQRLQIEQSKLEALENRLEKLERELVGNTEQKPE